MTNQRKTGAILSYILLAVSNIVGIIYTPFMIRAMGQAEFGLYSMIASTVGYLTVLDFGIGTTSVRYIAKYRAKHSKEAEHNLNGMLLVVDVVFGAIVVCAGVLLFANIGGLFQATLSVEEIYRARIMTLLLVFNIAVTFSLGIFRSIITAYERFVFLKTVNIIRVVLMPCIMIPLLLAGHGAIAMVTVTTVLNIISITINVVYCFFTLRIKFVFHKFDAGLLKQISKYSFFVFLGTIVDQIYWGSGQLILGVFSGTIAVAIYAIAIQFTRYFMNFSTAINGVFLPKITQMVARDASDKDVSDMFIKVGRIQYIVVGLIMSGFLLYGRRFISLWAGYGFIMAYYIAIIIMIPLSIPLIQNMGIVVLQAKNKHKVRSIIYLCIAILNIIISLGLSRFLGAFGPAISTAISLFIGNIVIINTYYYKKIHIDIPKFWKNIGKMTIPIGISLLIGMIGNLLVSEISIIILVLKVFFYTIIYGLCMWLIGMNASEKNLFESILLKLKWKDSNN